MKSQQSTLSCCRTRRLRRRGGLHKPRRADARRISRRDNTLGVMNRLARPLLLLPAVASAGTSDPGGIASAILWLVLIAFGVWIVVSIFVGRALTRSTPLRLVLAVSLSSLPLAYCGFTSHQFDNGLKDLAAENQALVSIANDYLAKRCAEDRVQRAARPVEPSVVCLFPSNPNSASILRHTTASS